MLTYMFSLPAAHVYYRHLADTPGHERRLPRHHLPRRRRRHVDQPRVDKGVIYAMTCLNEFLTKMQATPHGATNLLDQSLV